MNRSGILGIAGTLFLVAGCGQDTPSAAQERPVQDGAPAADVMTAWSLDPGSSRIGFVSIKAGEVIEAHHFDGLSGGVSPTGEAMVEIPLDRVETKVDIRNERMREMFFETDTYPVATITTDVSPEDYAGLAMGARTETAVDAVLSLHGQEVPVTAQAYVTRIGEDRIEVASIEPIVLSLGDFGLEAGLEALREVAGLPAITASSAVTFTFVFAGDQG